MNTRTSRFLLAAFVSITLAACNTTEYYRDYDPAADFDGYSTFAYVEGLDEGHTDRRGLSALDADRVIAALDAELAAAGFEVASAATADLWVDFSFSSQEVLDVDTFGTGFSGGFGTYPYRSGYGAIGAGQQISVDQRTEGTLVVDLIDREAERLVWRGWAVRAIDGFDAREPEERAAAFRSLIAGILERFPPGSAD